jgi:hypothetical protein
VFGLVQRYVDDYLREHPHADARTERVLSFDATNRLIDGACYLFFGEDERHPALVAKAARTTSGKAVFDTEYRNLEILSRKGMNSGWSRVPTALGRWEVGDVLITLQSALEGSLMGNVPAASLFGPDVLDVSLGGVFHWWLHFQRCLGTRAVRLVGDVYESEVLGPIERFRNRYVLDRDELAFLERRFERERALEGAELPFMVRHGDFCPANAVLGEQGVGIFDWEFPLRHKVPLFDLFFFFASLRFPYRGWKGESSHLDSFAAVYWEDSYFRTAARNRLREACERFGVPRETLPDLLVLALIDVANMKYDGLLESHGLAEIERATDDQKRARWRSFDRPDRDAPFACTRNCIFENFGIVARRGAPEI